MYLVRFSMHTYFQQGTTRSRKNETRIGECCHRSLLQKEKGLVFGVYELRLVMCVQVQPVPEKMRPQMVVSLEIRILNGYHRSLFRRLI